MLKNAHNRLSMRSSVGSGSLTNVNAAASGQHISANQITGFGSNGNIGAYQDRVRITAVSFNSYEINFLILFFSSKKLIS